MSRLYRFSPIKNSADFDLALDYITQELIGLSLKLLGTELPITTLKVFAHYQDEYEFLHNLVSHLGPETPFSSKTSLYVNAIKTIQKHRIEYIGVRIVDPYRLHVGCGDYEIPNFKEFKQENLNKSNFIREFSDDMIEMWHPDFDILGYVVPPL